MAIEYKPVTQQALQDTAKANIGARRSKYMRDLMDQITFQKRLPGSDLEGASRVFTGLLSGYHEGKLSNQELAQREALVKALEGENLSPMEMQLAAQGDPSTINSIVQNRLAERTYGRRRADSLSDAEAAHKRALELKKIEERVRLAAEKRRAEQIAQRDAKKFEQQKELAQMKAGAKSGPDGANLSTSNRKEISDMASQVEPYFAVTDQFKDEYAGMGMGSDTVAGMLNWFARTYPEMAGEKAAEAAQWWQKYKRHVELIAKHELFGAAFTATEALQWKGADIGPAMAPGTVREAIRFQRELFRTEMKRRIASLVAGGRNTKELSAMVGFDVTNPESADAWINRAFENPEAIPKAIKEEEPQGPPAAKPAMTDTSVLPKRKPPEIGEVINGYRYKGGNPNEESSYERVQ